MAVIEADARFIEYDSLGNEVDLIAAGAPCQPFSLAGKHRGDEDGRNMFPEVFRAIRALRPRAVLLENVRGLTRTSFRPYFNYILSQLSHPHVSPSVNESWVDHYSRLNAVQDSSHIDLAAEYDVQWRLLNSANYGVPQKRERVFVVAFRRDLAVDWTFPNPTHSEDRLLYDQYVTGEYWSQRNLQPRPLDSTYRNRIRKLQFIPPAETPWNTLHDAIAGLPEPEEGVNSDNWTFHIGIPGARVYKGHTGNDLHRPAKTIKAGAHGNPGGEHVLLRDDGTVRYLTVRECARVQTFPDSYQFSGSRSEAMRQIGNAVPVDLASKLADSIRKAVLDESGSRIPELAVHAVARRLVVFAFNCLDNRLCRHVLSG